MRCAQLGRTVIDAITIRRVEATDVRHVQQILYLAIGWNEPAGLPPLEEAMKHPELQRYFVEWGRPGDDGCIAERDGEFVGGAVCRLFTDDDHGSGYLASDVPELGIGVIADERGKGLGGRLLGCLADIARDTGIRRLSLSVNKPNPARHLYTKLGYRTVSEDGDSLVMVLDIS